MTQREEDFNRYYKMMDDREVDGDFLEYLENEYDMWFCPKCGREIKKGDYYYSCEGEHYCEDCKAYAEDVIEYYFKHEIECPISDELINKIVDELRRKKED